MKLVIIPALVLMIASCSRSDQPTTPVQPPTVESSTSTTTTTTTTEEVR